MAKSLYCIQICALLFGVAYIYVHEAGASTHPFVVVLRQDFVTIWSFAMWLAGVLDFSYIFARRCYKQFVSRTGKPSLYKKITSPFVLLVLIAMFYWWATCIYRRFSFIFE